MKKFAVILFWLLFSLKASAQYVHVGSLGNNPEPKFNFYISDLKISATGKLYVSEYFSNIFSVVNYPDLTFSSTYHPTPVAYVSAFAIDDNTGTFYLLSNGRIYVQANPNSSAVEIGTYGAEEGQLNYLYDIEIHNGFIWVTDFNSRIHKVTLTGQIVSQIPVQVPYALEITSNGDIYVSSDKVVKKFNQNGDLLNESPPLPATISSIAVNEDGSVFAAHESISFIDASFTSATPIPPPASTFSLYPTAMATDAEGKLLIAHLGGTILKFDPTSGNPPEPVLGNFKPGNFSSPNTVRSAVNNTVYVSDSYNNRIQVFSEQGNLIRTFGTRGIAPGQLNSPWDLAVDTNLDCYVMDYNGVTVFNEEGVFLRRFSGSGGVLAVDQNYLYMYGNLPTPGLHRYDKLGNHIGRIIEEGTQPGKIEAPTDIMVDPSGSIYVVENNLKRIQKFSNTGVPLDVLDEAASEPFFPFKISRSQDGKLYVIEWNKIHVFDAEGDFLETFQPETSWPYLYLSFQPQGIAIGSTGDIFMSDFFRNRVIIYRKLKPANLVGSSVSKTYGDASFTLSHNTNSDGALVYRILEGNALGMTAGGVLQILQTGEVSIEIQQSQTYLYSAAKDTVNVQVSKADLLITADSHTRIYGEANPAITFTIAPGSFKYSDNVDDIDVMPVIDTEATQQSPVGNYPVTFSEGSDDNYKLITAEGVVQINPAPLILKAENKSRVYKTENPELTFQYSGFKNEEDVSVLSAQPALHTEATVASNAGNYPIVISGAAGTNYNITYTPGTLEVQKANQEIAFDQLQSPVFSTLPPFFLTATASSGLSVAYSVTGPATVNSTTVTLSGTLGSVTVQAAQPGNQNYHSAQPVIRSFEVISNPVLGVEDETNRVHVYPNPAKSSIFLEAEFLNVKDISLVNSTGSVSPVIFRYETNRVTIDLGGFSDGIYMLQVRMDSGSVFTRKLLIRH